MENKKYFDFVNIAKLILAISVVALHSGLVPAASLVMKLLCRLAVPYFFVASGFLLKRNCTDGAASACRRYTRRLLLPYVFFSVIWIIQLLIDDWIDGVGITEAAIGLIQNIVFYPLGALWYIWASIIGVWLLYPVIRKSKLIRALPLGVILFMAGLLAHNYYFVADGIPWLKPVVDDYLRICLASNNALFVAYVFLLIGMILYDHYDRISAALSLKILGMIAGLSGILLLFEAAFIEGRANSAGDGAFYLCQLIYVPAVFFLTTKIECPKIKRSFIQLSKNLSAGIYFLHVPVLWIIHRSAKHLMPRISGIRKIAPLFDHASVCFVCCLCMCTAICLISYKYPDSFICRVLK